MRYEQPVIGKRTYRDISDNKQRYNTSINTIPKFHQIQRHTYRSNIL